MNKQMSDEVKRIAVKSLIFGTLAIASTMSFYFGYFIIDSIGHILQIDSLINSFCIIAVFDWNMNKFCRKYVFWCTCWYIKQDKRKSTITNSRNVDSVETSQTVRNSMIAVASISSQQPDM